MQNNYKGTFLTLLVLVMIFSLASENSLLAATTGKISGKVYDTKTGEVLPGANIIIEGTTMGAATDFNGEYFIINVPPGKYTVVARMMGYETIKKQEVLVQVGLTTPLDFSMNPTVIVGKEVTVVAERPVIQVDVANSQTILQGSEIEALPVSNFKEVLDKQVGIREIDSRGLFMRGQRQSAISLTVDGFETRDNVDDQVYTRFNPDELEQVEINAGGFDAAYGNASAGVINLMTKEGGKTYTLTFDYRQSIPARKHFGPPLKYYWDKYYMEGWSDSLVVAKWKPRLTGNPDDTLATLWEDKAHRVPRSSPFRDRPELLKELYRWRMRDEVTRYGDKPDLVLNATFGGPVPFIKNTTFFTSYRREKNYYLYPGPLDHFFDQNGMVKLTSHLTSNMKLSLNFRYTETTGLNRYDYYLMEASRGDLSAVDPDFQTEKRYVYEGVEQVAWSGYGAWPYTGYMGLSHRFRNQYGLTFTHTLSPRTFYEVKLMANYFRVYGSMGALRDTSATVTLVDPADPNYSVTLKREYALAPLGHWPVGFTDPGLDMPMAGTYGYTERNFANDITFRVNLTSQIDRYNQVNVGFQYTYYDIKKNEDRVQGTFRDDDWKWHVYPRSFAFWATDKLEFEGMVLDVGVRGDVRIPDEWLDLKHYPWDYHWSDKLPADSNLVGPHYNPPWKLALAPRLKISHPIGQTAKIFFNWGHYYQDPPLERQYMFYRRGGALTGAGWTMYGDPELPYIKSIQVEIGYEHNLWNIFRIAASGYYKDVKNLLMDRIRMDGNPRQGDPYEPNYGIHGANRYLSSQGFEARLEKRTGQFWTAWFNFNYEAYTRGVYGFKAFHEDTTKTPDPFDYAAENRKRPPESRFNLGVDIHTPSRFGPGFLRFYPAADISLNLLLWWRQQPAFTYNPERLPAPYAPKDNMRWKAHWGVNMVFNKRFDFGSFITPIFYVEVYNLLNTKNMFRGSFNERPSALEQYVKDVLEAGAKPGERGDLAEKAIGNDPSKVLHNPVGAYVPFSLYLNPRQIWFGIRFEIK